MVTRIGLVLVGSSSVCESVASLSHVDRVGKVASLVTIYCSALLSGEKKNFPIV